MAMITKPRPPQNAGSLPKLSTVAALAFLVGLALWGSIACLMLGAGGGGGSNGVKAPAAAPNATSQAGKTTAATTPLPDRHDCNEIRGTQYRSDAERDFFQANCIAPPPTEAPATPTSAPATTPSPGPTTRPGSPTAVVNPPGTPTGPH